MNSVDDGMICAGVDQGGDSKLASFDGDDYGEDGEVADGYGGGRVPKRHDGQADIRP